VCEEKKFELFKRFRAVFRASNSRTCQGHARRHGRVEALQDEVILCENNIQININLTIDVSERGEGHCHGKVVVVVVVKTIA
jgi:hypothetical protein